MCLRPFSCHKRSCIFHKTPLWNVNTVSTSFFFLQPWRTKWWRGESLTSNKSWPPKEGSLHWQQMVSSVILTYISTIFSYLSKCYKEEMKSFQVLNRFYEDIRSWMIHLPSLFSIYLLAMGTLLNSPRVPGLFQPPRHRFNPLCRYR